jgi:alpha-galactosidase/6-phospho-beta-glucosidase family protein
MEKTNKYNGRSRLRTLPLTLTLTLTCLSCAQIGKSQDRMLVKDTIMSYNKLLVEAAKTGDVEPLKDIMSEKGLKRLYFWIASWHDSNVYMDGRLESIKFKNITMSGNAANVITSEDWVYEYKNLETRQSVLPASAIYYEMEYILQKKDDRWAITEINIKAERK